MGLVRSRDWKNSLGFMQSCPRQKTDGLDYAEHWIRDQVRSTVLRMNKAFGYAVRDGSVDGGLSMCWYF